MEVSRDRIPASTEEEITISHSTLLITTVVPIIAAADCAIVLNARIPAALHHILIFTLFI